MSINEAQIAAATTPVVNANPDDRGDDVELELEDPAAAEVPDPVAEVPDPADETPDPASDDAADDDDDDIVVPEKKVSKMVPRQRLDKVREREKAANARIEALEQQLNSLSSKQEQNKGFEEFTTKVDSLYEQVEQARAEGDYKAAAKLQRELDGLRDTANHSRADYVSKQAALRVQEEIAFNALVDQAEALAPELNPKDGAFDPDTLEEVDTMTRSLEAQGVKTAVALKRAMKYVLGRDVFAEKTLPRAVAPGPKKTDIVKNVAAAQKIPPVISGAQPEREAKVDVSKLTDAEMAKLPESVKARLRGDFV